MPTLSPGYSETAYARLYAPTLVAIYNETGNATLTSVPIIGKTYSYTETGHATMSVTPAIDKEYAYSETAEATFVTTHTANIIYVYGETAKAYELYDIAHGSTYNTTTEGREIWVVNLETGASTRYEDFPFNSLTLANGIAVGASADGIFALTGDTDNGTVISANVDLGDKNFESAQAKLLPYAYMGVASTKKMKLKVTVRGREYSYLTRANDQALRQQRVDIGRGLEANVFGLAVHNHLGGDFELESVEFVPIQLRRRVP